LSRRVRELPPVTEYDYIKKENPERDGDDEDKKRMLLSSNE